jgi:hypothetical protein
MAKASNSVQTELVYKCDKSGPGFLTQIIGGPGKRLSFKCDHCGLVMFPVFPTMTISAHGHTKNTIGHTLLSARQLGVSDGVKPQQAKAK